MRISKIRYLKSRVPFFGKKFFFCNLCVLFVQGVPGIVTISDKPCKRVIMIVTIYGLPLYQVIMIVTMYALPLHQVIMIVTKWKVSAI